MREINEIILHCTATKEGKDFSVEQIRKMHVEGNGWSDIGYHFLVYLDGTVMAGRPIEKIGAHCSGRNEHSIGVCYVGGLDANGKAKDTRTPQQKDSLFDLCFVLMQNYGVTPDNVRCHNEFANKNCPCFPIEEFRDELKEYIASIK